MKLRWLSTIRDTTEMPRREPRFSEVFVGKIATDRMTAYLRKLRDRWTNIATTEVFNIPLEGRTLRVALLSVDTVAASEHEDPAVLITG